METVKWRREEVETHIKTNVTDYGSAVVVSALFKKLYGEYPRIGLSGYQASAIDCVVEHLPEALEN